MTVDLGGEGIGLRELGVGVLGVLGTMLTEKVES